jgi:hypothetical protein
MECRDIAFIVQGAIALPIAAILCIVTGHFDRLLLVGIIALIWYLRVKWLLKIADHHWQRFHGK